MKKLIFTALCGLAAFSMGAQQANVDQAKKLAGKTDKIGEARTLIKEALQNPETAGKALTLYTAGKIEWDAYDKNSAKQLTNPDGVNPVEMSEELINGYNYFIQVFPLDQLPNEKGEIKPKYTKELQKKIADKRDNFFNAGAILFNEKKFYPEAYEAFMIYGDLPEVKELGNHAPQIPDTLRATSYFNAGISAWYADKLDEAAIAFRKARENNYPQAEACIYELACWQQLEQRDPSREAEAMDKIYAAASAGFEKFGMEKPVFLNNIVNTMVNKNREADALEEVNKAIAIYPENASLYGLRGYVNDRMDKDDDSIADYRKAAAIIEKEYAGVTIDPNDETQNEKLKGDYETLFNAIGKLFRVGQTKWNNIELGDPDIRAKKDDIRTNYFEVSKKLAEMAKTLNPEKEEDINYLLERIDYQLSL